MRDIRVDSYDQLSLLYVAFMWIYSHVMKILAINQMKILLYN